MSPLSPAAQQALEQFQACQQWEQRARLLLQWSSQLTELPKDLRTAENLVQGCETRVWLVLKQKADAIHFEMACEARLLRGLLALLLVRIEGLNAAQITQIEINEWFNQLGLSRQLSPSRSNGLNAVLKRMEMLLQEI
ncbi:SufE family protein [Denitrificimonas sp. JX-1]|uniref:SufE family protein n=1 Tax=Denitrificimonas halotolerans TaxID=3098930 RepID=A0ABU5GMJ6_9GAMM|nr:SufE family protein [Denitrificimonas sp. JX-1]MDY7218106.1 SufE family protein [Denitrificimonas sp. JX-1]